MTSPEAGLIEGPRYSLEELGHLQEMLSPSQRVQFEEITKGRYLTPDEMGEIMEKMVNDSAEMAKKFERSFLQQLTPQELLDLYESLGDDLQQLHEKGYSATTEQIDRMIALAQDKSLSLVDKIIEIGSLIHEIRAAGK